MKLRMERSKEIVRTVGGFLRSSIRPVYLEDDIPPGFDPLQKIVQRSAKKPKKLELPLTIVSWNILRDYNKQKIREEVQRIIKDYNPSMFLFQEAPASFWEDSAYRELALC